MTPNIPQARSVDAGRGASWIGEGFELFKASAGNWILVTVIWIALALVAALVPLIGSLAFSLFTPVFAGGLMLGCQAQREGGELLVEHLFAGFKSPYLTPLLAVGALVLAVQVVIQLLIGSSMLGLAGSMMLGRDGMAPGMLGAGAGSLLLMLVGLALTFGLMMATWFAPALVVLRSVPPVDAMKASFQGCVVNFVPFLVYGLLVLVIAVIASLPLMLGWLVAWPVLTASAYTGCADIFPAQAQATAPAAS